jgi:hypothetical protein
MVLLVVGYWWMGIGINQYPTTNNQQIYGK